MGLFGGNYAKPGPGVDKDAPKKKGLFLYFDILTRKFTKLIQANLIYSLMSILWIAVLYFLSMFFTQGFIGKLTEGIVVEGMTDEQIQSMYSVVIRMVMLSGIWLIIGSGPASAGLSYILKCFTHEEHAWIWGDFKDKMKENFKQAIIMPFLDLAVMLFGVNACVFYYASYQQSYAPYWFVLFVVMCIMLLIYAVMHFFIYPLMVTFETTFSQLFKNAFLLALAKLPMCVLFMLLGGGVLFAAFSFLNPMIVVAVLLFGGYGLMRFPVEFYVVRAIDKLMPDMKKKQPASKMSVTYLDDDEDVDAEISETEEDE